MTRIARLFAMAALALAWTCPAEARPVTVFAAASISSLTDHWTGDGVRICGCAFSGDLSCEPLQE